MNKKKATNIFIFICLFFSLACLAFYFVNFHSMPISKKTSDWSNFGSYVAGTIGPLLSLASILFIIKSINATNENHHELMEFSINDKIHNQIKDLADTLKTALDNNFIFKDNDPSSRTPEMVIISTLEQEFRYRKAIPSHSSSSDEEIAANAVSNYMVDFNPQIKLVCKLTMLLNKLDVSQQEVYKLLIETKITDDQRAVIYCFACKDLVTDALLIREQWPSFPGSIFND